MTSKNQLHQVSRESNTESPKPANAVRMALFDFDGTLSKGLMGVTFYEYLHKVGVYDKKAFAEQVRALKDFKSGALSYERYLQEWSRLWVDGIKGKDAGIVMPHAKAFFADFKSNIYPSSRELMDVLKTKGYTPAIISVSPYEVVALAAKELGVEIVYATKLNLNGATYTNELVTRLHMPGGKKAVLSSLSEAGKEISFAFGDTETDYEMLCVAKVPVPLNPTKGLKVVTDKMNWPSYDKDTVVSGIESMLRNQ